MIIIYDYYNSFLFLKINENWMQSAINFQSLIHHTRKHKLINLPQNLVHIHISI